MLIVFRKGEVIKVMEKDPSGWWVGEVDGRMGFFPSVDWVEEITNPVPAPVSQQYQAPPAQHQPIQHQPVQQQPAQHQPIQHQPVQHQSVQHQPVQHQPIQHQPAQNQQRQGNPNGSVHSQSHPPPGQPQDGLRRCKALFPMDAQNATELTLRVGDIISIEKEADGWFLGTNTRGERGIFPASFVVVE